MASEYIQEGTPRTTASALAVGTEPGILPAHPALEPDHHDHYPVHRSDLLRIVFVGLAALAVWLRIGEPLAHFSLIGALAIFVGAWPIFKEALTALAARRMTMELSMTIAIVAAMAISEFFTALVIVLFVLVAEVLEHLTLFRGRRAIKELLDLMPAKATVRRGGSPQEIQIADIRSGDAVIVKPGARIPVDGIVLSGNSFVDQAAITGESMPVEKVAGTVVYAGTINQSGALEVQPVKIGRDTAFGRILEAVEEAERSKAPIQKTADRLAGYLVFFAIGCAALTFLVTHDVRSTISVVIVAGACGIAAGTPLAILGAVGRAAREGAIIKGGLYLELLGLVDTVVFDKTGTLTFGNPAVVSISPASGFSEAEVLAAAATAEKPSEHPVGRAILRKAAKLSVSAPDPDQFDYAPGKGITCRVGADEIVVGSRPLLQEKGIDVAGLGPCSQELSEVMVARGGQLVGSIHIADVLRPEAKQAVARLKQMGVHTVLLTGDSKAIAAATAEQLEVDEVKAELLPEQKLERIKNLVASGRRVAMVGDGINDAPALMQATVGVAVGSGTDVARESADIVLLGNDLLKITDTISLARWCRRIIMTNFAGTLVVDGVGVGLAAFGFLNPLLAAFIHVASELVFILNSARLLPGRARLSGGAGGTSSR